MKKKIITSIIFTSIMFGANATEYVFSLNDSIVQDVTFIQGNSVQKNNFSCKDLLENNNELYGKDGFYTLSQNENSFRAYCDMTTDEGGWTRLIHEKAAIENIESVVNTTFGNGIGKLMRYELPNVETIYYKRKTSYELNFYRDVISTFRNTDNTLHNDFELYSTYDELLNKKNEWMVCNFANDPVPEHTYVGFPRDCGKSTTIPARWLTTDITSDMELRAPFTSYHRAYTLWIK